MNSCGIQRSSIASSVSDHGHTVVRPKPRRVGLLNHHPIRSLRYQVSHQIEPCESNPGSEILDFILPKSDVYEQDHRETAKTVESPPQFFSGSPPSRVANPLTKDSRFIEELLFTPQQSTTTPKPLSPQHQSSPRNVGCVRNSNFGNSPAIRIVGFDCDRRSNRSVSARA